jgi:hypothetical protein
MTAIRGFPTSDKIVSNNQSDGKNEYATLQQTGSKRVSLDTVNRGVTQVTSGLVVAAGSGNIPGKSPTIITTVPHGAVEGNLMRFTAGVLNGQEITVGRIINPTSFAVGTFLPPGIAGSTFTLFRYITPTYDATGSAGGGGGPGAVGFATEVKQDVQIANFEAARPEYNSVLPIYPDNSKVELQTDVNGRLLVALPTPVVPPVANPPTVILTTYFDYAATNVTNAAWVQLVPDTGSVKIDQISLYDTSGWVLEVGIGPVGAETRLFLINPGGFGVIDVNIPPNSRVSVRAITGSPIAVGELTINYIANLPTPLTSVILTTYLNYALTNVTNAAWTQLVAATGARITKISLYDTSGFILEVGLGAPGAESRLFIINAGGFGSMDVLIPAASRVSIRAITGSPVSIGDLTINYSG